MSASMNMNYLKDVSADVGILNLGHKMCMKKLTAQDYKNHSQHLCVYFMNDIHMWWNKDLFDWSNLMTLIATGHKEFTRWYDCDKIWTDDINKDIICELLTKHCGCFRDIWYPDYVAYLIVR